MALTSLERLRTLASQLAVIRACDLRKHGIHPQILKRVLNRRLLVRIDRGLYTAVDNAVGWRQQLALACKRVPHGVVCLHSALHYHGLVSSRSDTVWMAIDRKARRPTLNGLRLRFVRFSGRALTQGVVNGRIDGVPVRIYSTAKTVADCFKYRRKLGIEVAVHPLQVSIQLKKCSRQRLLHFAHICHVGKLFRHIYSYERDASK
jgi:predicted transcriptional regulator of viral defense system